MAFLAFGIWAKFDEVLKIAQLLTLVIFVSIHLVRENLRGLRENIKHKIPTYMFDHLAVFCKSGTAHRTTKRLVATQAV